MKELSTEEKAKRYDAAVNEIKNLRDMLLKEGVINKNGIICNNFNRIFPELKESEEKPVKVPKFKVGEWIINAQGTLRHIINVDKGGYQTDGGWLTHDTYEKTFHLWTIQDVKDGDVLCTYECGKPKIVFILKGAPKKPYILGYHCYYNIMYPHFEFDSEKGCLAPNEEDVKPATKEQRDTLMKAIADAGYIFDFDKKKLKKNSI